MLEDEALQKDESKSCGASEVNSKCSVKLLNPEEFALGLAVAIESENPCTSGRNSNPKLDGKLSEINKVEANCKEKYNEVRAKCQKEWASSRDTSVQNKVGSFLQEIERQKSGINKAKQSVSFHRKQSCGEKKGSEEKKKNVSAVSPDHPCFNKLQKGEECVTAQNVKEDGHVTDRLSHGNIDVDAAGPEKDESEYDVYKAPATAPEKQVVQQQPTYKEPLDVKTQTPPTLRDEFGGSAEKRFADTQNPTNASELNTDVFNQENQNPVAQQQQLAKAFEQHQAAQGVAQLDDRGEGAAKQQFTRAGELDNQEGVEKFNPNITQAGDKLYKEQKYDLPPPPPVEIIPDSQRGIEVAAYQPPSVFDERGLGESGAGVGRTAQEIEAEEKAVAINRSPASVSGNPGLRRAAFGVKDAVSDEATVKDGIVNQGGKTKAAKNSGVAKAAFSSGLQAEKSANSQGSREDHDSETYLGAEEQEDKGFLSKLVDGFKSLGFFGGEEESEDILVADEAIYTTGEDGVVIIGDDGAQTLGDDEASYSEDELTEAIMAETPLDELVYSIQENQFPEVRDQKKNY